DAGRHDLVFRTTHVRRVHVSVSHAEVGLPVPVESLRYWLTQQRSISSLLLIALARRIRADTNSSAASYTASQGLHLPPLELGRPDIDRHTRRANGSCAGCGSYRAVAWPCALIHIARLAKEIQAERVCQLACGPSSRLAASPGRAQPLTVTAL